METHEISIEEVDPAERRLRLVVSIIEREDTRGWKLPDDPSFFLHALWRPFDNVGYQPLPGAFDDVITEDQIANPAWVDAHTWRFIEEVERLPDDFDGDDPWGSAIYDVRLTDGTWVARLTPRQCWDGAYDQTRADVRHDRAEDRGRIPDLRRCTARLDPFTESRAADGRQDRESRTPDNLAFSDDGRYLAVTNDRAEVAVFDTVDWSERGRVPPPGDWLWCGLQWLAARHVLLQWQAHPPVSRAYDLDAAASIEAPDEVAELVAGTSQIRPYAGEGAFVELDPLDGRAGHRIEFDLLTNFTALTQDQSRLFVQSGPDVHVLALPEGRVTEVLAGVAERAGNLAASPDGAYLAVAASDGYRRGTDIEVVRVPDGELVLRRYVPPSEAPSLGSMAWSPDGRWFAVVLKADDDGYGGHVHVFPVAAHD
jgi:hypothetical protein